MKITLKLYALLGKYLPQGGTRRNEVEIDVAADATVLGILDDIGVPREMCHLVLVNGEYVAPSDRVAKTLKAGDALAVWPPVAGG